MGLQRENSLNDKIFIDVTVTANVPYTSGIQRVVKEMTNRLLEMDEKIVLGEYDEYHQVYKLISPDSFKQKMSGNTNSFTYTGTLKISEMAAPMTFVDMDSVWNNYVLRRQNLYKQLHEQGVKLGAMVYDIIPITYPQYCHQETIFHFLLWMSAVLEYVDFVMVNTDSTRKKVEKLLIEAQLPQKNIYVVPLGADFKNNSNISVLDVSDKVSAAISAGKYLLMVGTLEPRKNHRMVVRAIHNSLKDENINLIIAGRNGWNMESFLEELKNDELFGKRIFYLEHPSDVEINVLYGNAFSLVIASFEEGYGLPIIEAFHYNKPVLATDIDVFREVGGECAVYFESDNEASLGENVKRLMDNSDLYSGITEKIKKYSALNWDEAAKMLYKTFVNEN